ITMPAGMRDLLRAAFFARHAGPESALPQYRAAIDADPKQPEPWLAMATYLLDIERPADAQALLDEALAAVPDNPTLQFLSSRRDLLHVAAAGPLYQPFGVAMIQFPEHRDAAVAVLELIRHASGSRQPIEQTVAELRRLVELHPRFLPIQTLLIEVCILSGRLEEATSVARRAMQAFPAAVEPAWAAATSLSAQGRWAEALA